MRRELLLASAVLLTPAVAFSQTTDAKETRFDLKLGYQRDYTGPTDKFYYDLALFGKTILNSPDDAAPEFTDFAANGLFDPQSRPLFFKAQRGLTEFGGSLLEGFSAQPLRRFDRALRDFNLVVGVDAQVDRLQSTAYQAQLEYKPLYPIAALVRALQGPKAISPVPNFLVVGAGEQHIVGADGATRDQGVVTFRGLIARSFYFGSDDGHRKAEADARVAVQKQYARVEDVEALYQKVKTGGTVPDDTTVEFQVYTKYQVKRFGAGSMLGQADWDALKGTEFYGGPPPNPNVVLWVDGNGRYAFTHDFAGTPGRFVWSANLKFYLQPAKPDSFYLQIQYLNGFNEATPTQRSNAFIALLGVKL